MLRFDYLINEQFQTVNVLVISETENQSKICGRLVLSKDEWNHTFNALDYYNDEHIVHEFPQVFKFQNKEIK